MLPKATYKSVLVLICTFGLLYGCSASSANKSSGSDGVPDVYHQRDSVSTDSVSTVESVEPELDGQGPKSTSSINSVSTVPTSGGTIPNRNSQTQLPPPSTESDSVIPTTIPRFIPFNCSVQVDDTSEQPTTNTRAIRISVKVDSTSISIVATEVRTNGASKRALIELNKSGSGYTQVVVPDGFLSTASIYASPDFIPDSKMCSAQG